MGKDAQSVKCLRDIRSIPPSAYKRPTDGRQWRHLCEQRQRLMWLLATYADSDGSRVWPGETTLAASMGLSRRAVTYRLADLKNLGFIENGGYHGERGPRIRTIKIDSIQAKASGAQSSADPECNLRDPERNLGGTGAQSSATGAQSSIAHDRPATATEPPPPPPTAGGGGWFEKYIAAMNAPGKKQRATLESMAAQHGEETAQRAVELLLERGLGNAKNPWAVFIGTADGWIEKAKQESDAAIQKANEAEIIEANVRRQKQEHCKRWFPIPKQPNSNEAGPEDYLSELEA